MTIKENKQLLENLSINQIEDMFRLRYMNLKKQKGLKDPETKKAFKNWYGFYKLTMAQILKIWQNG